MSRSSPGRLFPARRFLAGRTMLRVLGPFVRVADPCGWSPAGVGQNRSPAAIAKPEQFWPVFGLASDDPAVM